jgi:hypothetical protein
MAFGIVQLGMAAAHLGDTALAYECVEYLVNNYWSPVMVSQHNRYEFPDVLNMDISGGLPAVIIMMLVQSGLPVTGASGECEWPIRLLPCLPDAWPRGSLKGVRCRGGFEINIEWAQGELACARVTSLRGETCRVECGEHSTVLKLGRGESATLRSPRLRS